MEKIIDEENKLTFDIEKFLNEDTKEDNELGFQLTCSILTKAWKKGVEEGFNHGYARGSICLDNRIQNLSDDYLNNPASNVADQILSSEYFVENIGPSIKMYDKLWIKIK